GLTGQRSRAREVCRIEIELGEVGPVDLPFTRRARTDTGLHHHAGSRTVIADDQRANAFDARDRALVDVLARGDFECPRTCDFKSWDGHGSYHVWDAGIDQVATCRDHGNIAWIVLNDQAIEVHDVAAGFDVDALCSTIGCRDEKCTVCDSGHRGNLAVAEAGNVTVDG